MRVLLEDASVVVPVLLSGQCELPVVEPALDWQPRHLNRYEGVPKSPMLEQSTEVKCGVPGHQDSRIVATAGPNLELRETYKLEEQCLLESPGKRGCGTVSR